MSDGSLFALFSLPPDVEDSLELVLHSLNSFSDWSCNKIHKPKHFHTRTNLFLKLRGDVVIHLLVINP